MLLLTPSFCSHVTSASIIFSSLRMYVIYDAIRLLLLIDKYVSIGREEKNSYVLYEDMYIKNEREREKKLMRHI